jgi:dCMP deaminase
MPLNTLDSHLQVSVMPYGVAEQLTKVTQSVTQRKQMNETMTTIHHDNLRNAYAIARQSKDQSNQNGAILWLDGVLLTTGANNFPLGVEVTEERMERPLKYNFIEHAERNALYSAARAGKSTFGATLYCPWVACADCARGIIQCGISAVITHGPRLDMTPERWKESVDLALGMLDEARVPVIRYEGVLFNTEPVIVNGNLWDPTTLEKVA